jgi:hypothetical protein
MILTPRQNRTRLIGVAVVAAVVAISAIVVTLDRATAGLDDGVHTVQVVARDVVDRVVRLDEVVLLTGAPAREAAVADGLLDGGDDLPNDYYLRDSEEFVVVLPVARRAELTLIEWNGGFRPAPADLNAFLAGEVQPFNGRAAVFDVTIEGGWIVAMSEIYLPEP